jgi:hypothetical protein
MKRICKCGKVFVSDVGAVRCDECLKYQNWLVTQRPQPRKNLPGEIHFSFYRSWTNEFVEDYDKIKINATCEHDKKDPKHHSVTVCLYNKPSIDDIIHAISEEYLHVAITESFGDPNEGRIASRKADNGLMNKLIQGGYL